MRAVKAERKGQPATGQRSTNLELVLREIRSLIDSAPQPEVFDPKVVANFAAASENGDADRLLTAMKAAAHGGEEWLRLRQQLETLLMGKQHLEARNRRLRKIDAVRQSIWTRLARIKPSLLMLHSHYGIGRDWSTKFDDRGRADKGHAANGPQAQAVRWIRSGTSPEFTGLEAWLLCERLCARCRGEAVAVLEVLSAGLRRDSATTNFNAEPTKPAWWTKLCNARGELRKPTLAILKALRKRATSWKQIQTSAKSDAPRRFSAPMQIARLIERVGEDGWRRTTNGLQALRAKRIV